MVKIKICITRLKDWFLESRVRFFLLSSLIWGIVLLIFDIFSDKIGHFFLKIAQDLNLGKLADHGFLENVLIEAHGMWFDLIVLGIILTLYEKTTERRNDIKRLEEEIDDYRHWKEPEATYRIIGCVKRLSRLNITEIKLNQCYLKNAIFDFQMNLSYSKFWETDLENADFRGNNLENCAFNGSNLRYAKFRASNLKSADFYKSCLEGTDFTESWLYFAIFNCADLRGVDFHYVKINNETEFDEVIVERDDWIEYLKKFNIEGYQFIVDNYIVEDLVYLDNENVKYFKVRSRA